MQSEDGDSFRMSSRLLPMVNRWMVESFINKVNIEEAGFGEGIKSDLHPVSERQAWDSGLRSCWISECDLWGV